MLSIIIVNWNVRDLLRNCLMSLSQHLGTLSCEVFVVDNSSTDGTAGMLREKFPEVVVIQNHENVGFSRANNQGIKRSRGRYILLLNPDTICVDDSIAKLVRFMDAHPDVGAAGPKLVNPDGSVQLEGARRLPLPFDTFCEYTRLSTCFPRSRWTRRHLIGEWDHQDSRPVECLSGACVLIRREVIEDVGDLDEGYPFNVEDIDWCHRVGQSRWTLYYLAEATIMHVGRQSIMKNRGAAALWAMRGVYRYYAKFYGRGTGLVVWALLWPVSVVKLLVWMGIYLLRPGGRQLAREQATTFWKICWLSPWPV